MAREALDTRVLAVCDAVGDFIHYWGFKRIQGRVWTLLALHRKPLVQVEVARRLNVSRSLVSETMAELARLGLVRPCGDHRGAPWEAVFDVWPTVSDVLRSREWILLEEARSALDAAVLEVELSEQVQQAHDYDLNRMRMLLRMTERFQAMLRILIALRVPNSLSGLGRALSRTASLVQGLGRLP